MILADEGLKPRAKAVAFPEDMRVMANNPLKKNLLFISLAGLLCAPGCCVQGPYRAHPEFDTRVKQIKTVTLMPPVVQIYEVFPSGVAELRDDWCLQGEKSVEKAFVEQMKEKRYAVRTLRADGRLGKEVQQVQALYKQVHKSVQLHSYGPQVFPEKATRFEYGLGSLEEVLSANGADSAVFIMAFEYVSPQAPKTTISVAVADTTGTILWYGVKGSTGKHWLKDPSGSALLVEDILSSFPKRAK
jgi:hypothetical protein